MPGFPFVGCLVCEKISQNGWWLSLIECEIRLKVVGFRLSLDVQRWAKGQRVHHVGMYSDLTRMPPDKLSRVFEVSERVH